LSKREAADFATGAIGYVWQFPLSAARITALETVAKPAVLRGESRRKAEASGEVLNEVDWRRGHHRSGEAFPGGSQRFHWRERW